MTKEQMIWALEDYWYKQQEQNPEELMDIPTAVGFYHAQSYAYVQREYSALIG